MSIPSRLDYENLIYSLPDVYPNLVRHSTLHLYSTSALTAVLRGEIILKNELRIKILEVLDFKEKQIRQYSYSVFHGEQKIRWYDPQPHSEEPRLAKTFPHHFHTSPDIKHNRQPAPGITFDSPNLSVLLNDCMTLGAREAGDSDRSQGDET